MFWDLKCSQHFRIIGLLAITLFLCPSGRSSDLDLLDLLGLQWSSLQNAPPILGPTARLVETYTGLTVQGVYRGFLYGNVAGGRMPGAAWNEEIRLTGTYEFGFLSKTLKGLSLTGGVRWREGQNPNDFVGATRTFQPSHVVGGRDFRLRPFYLTYVTPKLFGVENFFTLSGGWQNPYDIFLQQPLSKLFVNRAIYTDKGLGANIPWTSSYVAWGGYFKIAPSDWLYTQAGFYTAVPGATATENHGVNFRQSPLPGTSNGLYAISETGIMPKIGPEKLLGKYVFGSYWYGARPDRIRWKPGGNGRFGFYWQADQQLLRFPAKPGTRDIETNQLSEKGLNFFTLFTYAPPSTNVLPFYFQLGFNIQGLIPTRNNDQLSIAYGYGLYSHHLTYVNPSRRHTSRITRISKNRIPPHLSSQSVFEIDYKIVLTNWLACKGYYQLLINPAANNTLKNANILGFAVISSF